MADIIENLETDRDTIPEEEIEEQFKDKYNLLTETAVTLRSSYINKLSVNKSLKIGISLQDDTLEVYELNNTSIQRVCRFEGHEKKVTEVVFHPNHDFLLFSTGLDGVIKLWDTRANGACIQEYREEADCPIRPYECMDISDIGNVFCSGSQLVKDDSYIVFWDPRSADPLGAYWESHTEDVTQVKFRPNTNTVLASGATDGLVNIFNLLTYQEENALTYSLNTGNSVEKLTWLNGGRLSCITQSNDLQVWNSQTGDLINEYSRDKIARSIKRSRDDDCYLVDAFSLSEQTDCLLAGSHGGLGHTLRSARAAVAAGRRLAPGAAFAANRQVVRCAHRDHERDLLITAGESGLISVWSGAAAADETASSGSSGGSSSGSGGSSSGSGGSSSSGGSGGRLHGQRHRPY